jgi:hypothetical protein
MRSRLVTMRLKKVGARLRRLRDDLQVTEEQRFALPDDSPDADALARHRDHLVQQIGRLEREQDELLDRLGGG